MMMNNVYDTEPFRNVSFRNFIYHVTITHRNKRNLRDRFNIISK